MTRVLVYEPASAGDPALTQALGRGSPAWLDLLEAGRAMRDAIVADLVRIRGITVTVAVGQQEARHGLGHRTIVQDAEGAVDFVGRQSRLHDLCWIVAPETGGLLAQLQAAVGTARWIGCSGPAIATASSKRATCATLHAAGIATPLDVMEGHRGAWIVKPDDGAGTIATRVHASRAAAEADRELRRACGQCAVLEPFVEGEPLSLSLVVGPVLARTLAFNRQRLELDARGWLRDRGVQVAAIRRNDARVPALEALGTRVAAALPGLRGYVGVDLVWNERKGPVVIEVNPRVTCAYVGLSAILQRNLALDILAAHGQEPAGHACA